MNVLLLQPPGGRNPRIETPASPAGSGPGANVEPDTVRAVQRELHRRGYYPAAPDGAVSLMTTAAVMGFEYDTGLPLTGIPGEAVLKALILGEAPAQGSRPERQPVAGSAAERAVREIQRSLARRGYGVGAIDGRLSEETVRAIREFEMDQSLKASGRISGPMIAKLTAPRPGRSAAARP